MSLVNAGIRGIICGFVAFSAPWLVAVGIVVQKSQKYSRLSGRQGLKLALKPGLAGSPAERGVT